MPRTIRHWPPCAGVTALRVSTMVLMLGVAAFGGAGLVWAEHDPTEAHFTRNPREGPTGTVITITGTNCVWEDGEPLVHAWASISFDTPSNPGGLWDEFDADVDNDGKFSGTMRVPKAPELRGKMINVFASCGEHDQVVHSVHWRWQVWPPSPPPTTTTTPAPATTTTTTITSLTAPTTARPATTADLQPRTDEPRPRNPQNKQAAGRVSAEPDRFPLELVLLAAAGLAAAGAGITAWARRRRN